MTRKELLNYYRNKLTESKIIRDYYLKVKTWLKYLVNTAVSGIIGNRADDLLKDRNVEDKNDLVNGITENDDFVNKPSLIMPQQLINQEIYKYNRYRYTALDWFEGIWYNSQTLNLEFTVIGDEIYFKDNAMAYKIVEVSENSVSSFIIKDGNSIIYIYKILSLNEDTFEFEINNSQLLKFIKK